MIYFYVVALFVYICLAYVDLSSRQWPVGAIIPYAIVVVPLLIKIHDQAKDEYLRYYFFFTRIRQKITNPTTKWSLVVSYDGVDVETPIQSLETVLLDGAKIRKRVVFHSKSNATIDFSIDETMHFFVEYHPADTIGIPEASVSVKLGTLEIGSNAATAKLEKEILPLVEIFQSILQARHTSYSLGINFLGFNPFYSRYLKNLKADAIDNFRINLVVNESKVGVRDSVEINKDGVSIVANSLTSLKKLAEDFIFQSPNLKNILPEKNA